MQRTKNWQRPYKQLIIYEPHTQTVQWTKNQVRYYTSLIIIYEPHTHVQWTQNHLRITYTCAADSELPAIWSSINHYFWISRKLCSELRISCDIMHHSSLFMNHLHILCSGLRIGCDMKHDASLFTNHIKLRAITHESWLTYTNCAADKELAAKFGVESSPKLVVVQGSDASTAIAHDGKLKKDELQVTLQHTATHCNTLQHTATHCNTLEHLISLLLLPMMASSKRLNF